MTLRSFQQSFGRLLFDGQREETDHRLLDEVRGDARASAEERLAIYAHAYEARLVDVLAEVYPRTRHLLGTEPFDALASAYVRAHPSRTPSLRSYGAQLPGTLAGEAASLAALEWARYDVFDAADARTLTHAEVATLGEQVVSLVLQRIPASTLVVCAHRADQLYAACAAEETTTRLVVWREHALVFHRVIEEREAVLLRALEDGVPLGVLCERVASEPGSASTIEAVAAEIFALVGRWIADGLLVAA